MTLTPLRVRVRKIEGVGEWDGGAGVAIKGQVWGSGKWLFVCDSTKWEKVGKRGRGGGERKRERKREGEGGRRRGSALT